MFKQNQQSKRSSLFSRVVATFKKVFLANSQKRGVFPADAQISPYKFATISAPALRFVSIFRDNLRRIHKSHGFLLLLPITSILGILALVSTFFISADLASNSYALDGTNLQSEVTAEIDGTHYVTLSASDVTFSITPTNGTASDKR